MSGGVHVARRTRELPIFVTGKRSIQKSTFVEEWEGRAAFR
jgi:hypothetical protein